MKTSPLGGPNEPPQPTFRNSHLCRSRCQHFQPGQWSLHNTDGCCGAHHKHLPTNGKQFDWLSLSRRKLAAKRLLLKPPVLLLGNTHLAMGCSLPLQLFFQKWDILFKDGRIEDDEGLNDTRLVGVVDQGGERDCGLCGPGAH